MNQWRHLIRPNASTRAPSQFICCQAASEQKPLSGVGKGWRHSFRAVVAVRFRLERGRVTREQWIYHEERGDFWEWFYAQLTPQRQTWLWCNDLVFHASILDLWGQLDSGQCSHRTACLTSRVGYISLLRGGCRAVWLDRRNWFEQPPIELPNYEGRTPILRKGLEGVGPIERRPEVFKAANLQSAVCQLVSFIRENDLGVLRITRAGQAMQAYRHKFGPRESESYVVRRGKDRGRTKTRTVVLPRVHNESNVLGLERDALFGGYTDCKFIGRIKGEVYHLDASALYPSVMQGNLFPCRLLNHGTAGDAFEWRDGVRPLNCIARVHVNTERPLYPLRRGEITIYPVGSFCTVLAGPELAEAVQTGRVDRIDEFAAYQLTDLFTEYVSKLWDLRQRFQKTGNDAWADLVKTLSNSLHGKFSQRANDWKETPAVMPAMRWGYWPDVLVDKGKVFQRRAIAGKTQTHVSKGWADHAFPAVACFVYAYARERMQEFFRVIKTGKVYYSAIDSIHTDEKGYRELIDAGFVADGTMGFLRLKEIANGASYSGPGDYQLGADRKQTGIPPYAQRNGDGSIEWPENEPAKKLIERKPDGSVLTRVVRVSPFRAFRHGAVGADGWVQPFRINE